MKMKRTILIGISLIAGLFVAYPNAAQVLGTAAAQTIQAITLTNTTNQIVLGTTNTVTVSSTAPSSSRTYTLPDAGAAANFGLFSSTPATLQTTPQTVYE